MIRAEYIVREEIFPNRVFYVNEENPLTSLNALINHICNLPTADVVPKSEVEEEIKNWQELYADTVSKWEKAYEELEIKLANAKTEVAREIFEEIELWLAFDGDIRIITDEKFAELKKKHAESENG